MLWPQCVNAQESEFFLFFIFCQHRMNATSVIPLHLTSVQYLLCPYWCNLCCNPNACPNLTALSPHAIGSEAGTFYLIKEQPKWNLRNAMIWSQPALCHYGSDVLRLCPERRESEPSRSQELQPVCWQVTVNQQSEKLQQRTPYWQHIANILNSNKNIINHWRQGQVCTSEEDMLVVFSLNQQMPQTGGRKWLQIDTLSFSYSLFTPIFPLNLLPFPRLSLACNTSAGAYKRWNEPVTVL